MRILVCVKQVPDIDSPLGIDAGTRWIDEKTPLAYRMNRYDEYALEEAVLIKEARVDVTIDALSVGPPRASATLKKSLGKGAHNAVHIEVEHAGYLSPLTTAALIAGYARGREYDLILTGVMAEDDMHCQVGPLLAALLGIPCAVSVIGETMNGEDSTVTAECELEGGLTESILLPLPSLLAIQTGINRPRYPSLSNVLRARDQEIIRIPCPEEKLPDAGESLAAIEFPEKSSRGCVLEGTTEEKAARLISILHERAFL